ncbi:MAG: hypothetical protein ACKVY0_15990 [Prosthecobacter sp.]|uniref:hypothetical protein n=1 Tax=Prosthecobacter sp. TaxID=1965333 RepID=UPI0038FFB8B1
MPPPIPISFAVFRGEEPAIVTLDFSSDADVQAVTRWQVPLELENDSAMQARAADACDFACFAAKRWQHYFETGTSAESLVSLQRMIATDAEGEFCFNLKVTADWFPDILGGALVRRTWCHHLMIDLLFVHPAISGKLHAVRNVGISIFRSICIIASHLGCERIWGEATRDSAAFYAHHLNRQVKDEFFCETTDIRSMAEFMETKRRAS